MHNAVKEALGAGHVDTFVKSKRRSTAWLYTRMAFQNLLRKPGRTTMLALGVALGTAAVFSSLVVGHAIKASMERGFSRMGADLLVVPESAMVNITSALLTVQPTDAIIDSSKLQEIAAIDGVDQVAQQTIYRVPMMSGMPGCLTNLIAFDPHKDFTVTPWLSEHTSGRGLQTGDIIAGGRRAESIGDEVTPANVPVTIYGKLARSGVGPLDESLFASYDTVERIMLSYNERRNAGSGTSASLNSFDHNRISAILVRLKFGATPEQVRFAIAKLPSLKVITGAAIVTSTRQSTTALVAGMMAFSVMMLLGAVILVSLIYSAIISERKRELGLLLAIGSRRSDIARMLMAEAACSTAVGGLCGLVLGVTMLLVLQHSLVYYLQTLHVDFVWPGMQELAITALACFSLSALVGLAGSALAAWKTSSGEPYALICGVDG